MGMKNTNRIVVKVAGLSYLAPSNLDKDTARIVAKALPAANMKSEGFKLVDVDTVANAEKPGRAVIKGKDGKYKLAPSNLSLAIAKIVVDAGDATALSKFKDVELVDADAPMAAIPLAQVESVA
jgi:hypothetical protein